MKRLFAVLVIVLCVAAGVFFLNLFVFVHTPFGETEHPLRIERGTPLNLVVKELREKGVISNTPLFKNYLLLKRAKGKIRAGDYTFPPHLKPNEVLALLMKGDFARLRITIPEGWTVREIAAHLGNSGNSGNSRLVNPDLFLQKCSDPAFISSLGFSVSHLEGYLFPDTYEIYKPKNEEEVLRKFVGHFKEVYAKNFEARAREVGLSEQEVVILASIVEKETGKKEEWPLVASVFLNRLKRGMPLASDPTIIYGIGGGITGGPNGFSGNLHRNDLNHPGPYNTYLNAGLPPTAISNPGADSIRAVLYPAETDYLYFVSKNDGTHHFSRTEAEHNAAVRKFQINRPRHLAETRPSLPILPSAPIQMIPIPETLSTSP